VDQIIPIIIQFSNVINNTFLSNIGLSLPRENFLLFNKTDIELIDFNNQVLQVIIILLVVAIFGYTAKLLFDRIKK